MVDFNKALETAAQSKEGAKQFNKMLGCFQASERRMSVVMRINLEGCTSIEDVETDIPELVEDCHRNLRNAGKALCRLNDLSGKAILDKYLNIEDVDKMTDIADQFSRYLWRVMKIELISTTLRFEEQ